MEPIRDVQVASLLVTCGNCEHGVTIEYDALDHEAGKVEREGDFQECPECGVLIDAQRATFSAYFESP